MMVYLLAAEYITADKGRGEVLLFRRKHKSSFQKQKQSKDEEVVPDSSPSTMMSGVKIVNGDDHAENKVKIQKQTSILHWRDVCYDIPWKRGTRRLLNQVDGWVQPGVLTALMVRLAI